MIGGGSATELAAYTTAQSWKHDAISIEGLKLAIGTKTLLHAADFRIGKEDRIALLGRNGCGKSTLFRWISDSAKSAAAPWSVYEVAQELPSTDIPITNVVLAAHLERGALWARQGVLEAKEELSEEEVKEYEANGAALEAMRADADPARVQKILHGLGFQHADMMRPLSTFSGGWRARVALAQGLFMEPDLLLLDEPTNHLDLEGVLWLSAYLSVWSKAFIVISHNTGFLRDCASVQWLIENERLTTYRCSYNRYLKQRDLDIKKAVKDWEKLEKEMAALKGKGTPAAKKTAEDLLVKRAAEGVVRPPRPYRPKFFFSEMGSAASNTSAALFAADEVTLGYEDKTVLADLRFALYSGTRVALVGANGSGKSTLVKFIAGELEARVGRVTTRSGLRVVKFDQHFYHSLPELATVLEYVGAAGRGLEAARRILGASGLEGAAHGRSIGTLSGGQKARVYFAHIALQEPDILLMDEPTNHLDMETVEALAAGLAEFPGAAIIVSHDLDFLEKVGTEVWHTHDGILTQEKGDINALDTYVESVMSGIEI